MNRNKSSGSASRISECKKLQTSPGKVSTFVSKMIEYKDHYFLLRYQLSKIQFFERDSHRSVLIEGYMRKKNSFRMMS